MRITGANGSELFAFIFRLTSRFAIDFLWKNIFVPTKASVSNQTLINETDIFNLNSLPVKLTPNAFCKPGSSRFF